MKGLQPRGFTQNKASYHNQHFFLMVIGCHFYLENIINAYFRVYERQKR